MKVIYSFMIGLILFEDNILVNDRAGVKDFRLILQQD